MLASGFERNAKLQVRGGRKKTQGLPEEDAQKKKDVQGELKDQEIALRKNIERICRRIRRTTFFWGSRSRSRQQQSTRWKLSTRTSGSGEGGWAVAIRLHPGPQQQQRVEEGDQGECAQEGYTKLWSKERWGPDAHHSRQLRAARSCHLELENCACSRATFSIWS